MRRQGERYFTGGLRDITSDRRLAIGAACVVEWTAAVADAVVETHDRIVGSILRDAKAICDARVAEAQAEIDATLAGFETLGSTLLMAKGDEAAVAGAVDASCGWDGLESLVIKAAQLRVTVKADALAHVSRGFHRFKLYARRMLTALEITRADVARPLRCYPSSLVILACFPRGRLCGSLQAPERAARALRRSSMSVRT